MRQLEKQYTYDIGQYPPKEYDCSSYLKFKEKTAELTERYFRNNKKSKNCDEPEDNYSCFDRITFFDEFMEGLQVVDVIHTIWLMYPKIFQHTVDPGLANEIFRPYYSPIKHYLNTLLKDKSKQGRVHWWIQVLLRKWWVEQLKRWFITSK